MPSRCRRRVVLLGVPLLLAGHVAVVGAQQSAPPTPPAPPAAPVPLVRAIVLDAERRPVAGAVIRVRGVTPPAVVDITETTATDKRATESTVTGNTVTDARGQFTLAVAGVVSVRRLGFAPLDTVLAPLAAEAPPYMLTLQPSAPRLARVVVHPGYSGAAPAPGAPGVSMPTVSMSRRDLESRPQPGDDLLRALARLPGIAATETSARLRVRGGAADELLYLFDGAELPDPFHLPDLDAALSMLDLRLVGGADLHAGTLPLELGHRTAGALVFPLPAFDGAPRTTSASLSLTGLRVAHHQPLGARTDVDATIRRGYLGLVLNALGESQGLTPRYGDVYLRLRHYGTRDRVSAHLLSGDDALRYARPGDISSTARYRTSVAWITTEHERGAWWGTSTWSLTDRHSTRDAVDEPGLTQSRFRDERRTLAAGVRLDARRALGTRHLLRLGAEWRPATSRFDVRRLRDTVAVVRGVVRRGIDTLRLDEEVDTRRGSAWLGVRSAWPWRVTQEIGVRVDAASWTGERLPAPRAAWLVPLTGATTLRVGIGVTTQAHLLEERSLADGDTARYPATRALQQAIGLAGEHGAARWRADVYWRRTTHERPLWVNARNGALVVPELLDDRVRLDAARGEASGVEFSVRDDGRSPWTWATAWVIARSRLDVNGRWVARPWDRRQTVTLDLGRAVGPWQFAAGWVYHSGDPTSTRVVLRTPLAGGGTLVQGVFPRPFDERLPEYHRLDLRAVRSWQRGGTAGRVFVDVLNVYDRRNVRRATTTISRNSSGVETSTTSTETGLPLLPSIGVSIDWR